MNNSGRRLFPVALAATVLVLLLALTACGEAKGIRRVVTPEEGRELLGSVSGILLIDVRTEEEHREKRIPNSLLLPVDDLAAGIENLVPDKKTPIMVYCRSGRRSALAADTLESMGYLEIYDLGGIASWPYETESGD